METRPVTEVESRSSPEKLESRAAEALALSVTSGRRFERAMRIAGDLETPWFRLALAYETDRGFVVVLGADPDKAYVDEFVNSLPGPPS